ncbi:MAG: caspase family protein [Cyanobacteria bacterium P01_F01_bin.150]
MARYALAIGIQAYESSPLLSLTQAAADAEDVAILLEQYGNFQLVKRLPEQWSEKGQRYHIHPKKRLSGEELGRSLQDFLLTQAHKQDALIYFSGHGISVSSSLGVKRGYLAASDCQIEVDGNGDIKDQRYGISLDDLNTLIQQSDLRSLVVILDCCHSGFLIDRPFTEQSLSAFQNKQDYCLITASRSFEQAWEGPDHSILTEAVLQGLSRENANPETGRVSGDRLFDFVYTRLQNSGQEPFRTGIGRSITLVTYPIGAPDSSPKANTKIDESIIPYRGLEPFEAEQAAFFFGRRQVVESIWNVLDKHRFVAVIGASGSGKSSTVRAGLVPWLQDADWTILEPIKPGINPLAELIATFKPYFVGVRELKRLDELVSTHPDGLRQIANRFDSTAHLLVIDQFEELFTVSRATERDRLIHLLTDLAQNPYSHLSIVITLRADFLEPCLAYPELTALIQHQAIFMPPLVGADLEMAIAQPAQKQGYSLEPGLLGEILHDVGQETGSLPLLQFALLELWERRDRTLHQLTRAAYTEMGGVMGALNDHAERIYNALESPEQEWAKRICLKLVRTGVGDRDTRQRQAKSALLELAVKTVDRDALESALDTLVNERLLMTGTEQDIAVIDLSHEALTEGWQRFNKWREENRELRRLGDRIEDAYREWERRERQDIFLLPKSITTQASLHDDDLNSTLSVALKDYLQASYAYEQKQARQLEWAKSEAALIARTEEAIKVMEHNPIEGLLQVLELVAWNRAAIDTDPIALLQSALYQAVEKCRECNRMDGHQAQVLDVTFSADGQLIASSGQDRAIRLWDLQGNSVGEPLQTLRGSEFPAIAFHPHQPLIVAGSDCSIWVWNYVEDQIVHRLAVHREIVSAIAISPDGNLIASGSRDSTIEIRSLDGQILGKIDAKSMVWSIVFHPDGQTIAAGLDYGVVCLWTIDGQPVGEPFRGHQAKVNSVCFSPEGSTLISGSNDHTIRIWDSQGNELAQFNEHDDEVKSVAFNSDGTIIGSCSRDGTIRLRTVGGEPIIEPLRGHTSSVRTIAFSPTQPILASGSHDDTIRIWNIEQATKQVNIQAHTTEINSVAISPNGKRIVSVGDAGTIRIWGNDGVLIEQPPYDYPAHIYSAAFSSDSKMLVTGHDDGKVQLWTHEGSVMGQSFYGHNSCVYAVSFSPDNQMIVSGSHGGTIRLWNIDGTRIGQPIKAHVSSVLSVAVSPDGNTVASSSYSGTIRLWTIGVSSISLSIQESLDSAYHVGSVYSVKFSPDNKLIACGCSDGTIRLCHRNGQPIGEPFRGHEDSVLSVSFSHDGNTLLSGSRDGSLRLWTLDGTPIGQPYWCYRNSEEFSSYKGDQGYYPYVVVNSVAFSPDGKSIVSGNSDGTIKIWQVGTWQNWLRECCDRLRYHPVFQNPPDETAREACEFCCEWCGW